LTSIILVGEISDLEALPHNIFSDRNTKVFSFDSSAHKQLESKKINHEMADNLLTQEERLQLFDKAIGFLSWHSTITSSDFTFDGVNLLKLYDSHEFLSYLLPNLINLIIIKKIIEREKPTKIICTSLFSTIVKLFVKQHHVETEFFPNKINNLLLWDKITYKYNIGKIPLAINVSRSSYLKIKRLLEVFFDFFYCFNLKLNKFAKKKSIIFLEFDPSSFSNLILATQQYDGNVILVNQRKSAIWNKRSINVIRKSKCKILVPERFLNKKEKKDISFLSNAYSQKIEKLWQNSQFFNNIFQIEGYGFWDVIKDVTLNVYLERLVQNMLLVRSVKKIFDALDVKCIISLNDVGETEKVFLELNNSSQSILLEHGFVERINKTKRFDVFFGHNFFTGNFAVWGETRKQWLVNENGVDPKRILVTGSPRHDRYFISRIQKKLGKEIILLLAPNPINDANGLSDTNLKLRYNNVIENTLSIIQKFGNVKIIVKLHPIQLKHNEEIKSLIQKLDNSVPIYLWTSVIDTINSVDAVMVISPEIHATPTMVLESMILGKPTMNIYFDEKVPEYEHIRSKSVYAVTDSCDLESALKKLLFDGQFQNELKTNADAFVTKFMSNRGTASESFASLLKSY